MQKKAVVLYSGGLDSTPFLALAKAEGFAPYALSFAYGQRHAVELDCRAPLRVGIAALFAPPTVINKLSGLFPEERFAGVRCVFTGTQTLELTAPYTETLDGEVTHLQDGVITTTATTKPATKP